MEATVTETLRHMKIFVSGADGFIGSHLVEELVRRGYAVKALACYNSFNDWGWLESLESSVMAAVEVITGDVRDGAAIRRAMAGCDAVMHLASLIAIPYSYRAPESYVDTNVRGTLNVLEAARELGVDRVVHTSTSEVYGTAQFVPITEEHPLEAQSPYAATKVAADQLALSYHRSFELPVTVVRPFNTYGPRQSARAVIPTIISQIARGKHEIRLGALSPTRDMNFVQDTVDGFLAALTSDSAIGEVVNVGTGFEISIGDLAYLIGEVMDADIHIVSDEERLRPEASEVERLLAANGKARRLLGWEPRFSGMDGLQEGLRITADWFRDPANLRHYKTDIYNV